MLAYKTVPSAGQKGHRALSLTHFDSREWERGRESEREEVKEEEMSCRGKKQRVGEVRDKESPRETKVAGRREFMRK